METTKKQMKYVIVMTVSFILFITAVVLLESSMISILSSVLLGIVGAVGLFYAGMKLDVFAFTEGSSLAKVNAMVNAENDVTLENANKPLYQVPPFAYNGAELVAYRQKRIQQRRFEEIAYTIKAVS